MNENKTFEELLEQLKAVVSDLENNHLPLDQAIAAFETGLQLTKQAEEKIKDIKDKVTKIVDNNKTSDFNLTED